MGDGCSFGRLEVPGSAWFQAPTFARLGLEFFQEKQGPKSGRSERRKWLGRAVFFVSGALGRGGCKSAPRASDLALAAPRSADPNESNRRRTYGKAATARSHRAAMKMNDVGALEVAENFQSARATPERRLLDRCADSSHPRLEVGRSAGSGIPVS